MWRFGPGLSEKSGCQMTEKVVLVTGASRGLGASIVSLLSSLGHKVLATARSGQALEDMWGDDPQVHWVESDLVQPESPELLVQQCLSHFGQLDGLINNAGTIHPIESLEKSEASDWARAIQVNLTAPALLMKAALPHLKQQKGRVVNISSGAAVKVISGWSAYCTSKAGLMHLTKAAALENPEVGFFSLRPGTIDTQMQNEIRQSTAMTEADLTKFRGLKSGGRLNPPEVAGRSATWLVLHGPPSRSGEFIQYTDDVVLAGVKDLFPTVESV